METWICPSTQCYHLNCLYPCDAYTLRAVHITFHTPPNLLTSPGSRLPWEMMARYPPSLLGRRAWATAPAVRRPDTQEYNSILQCRCSLPHPPRRRSCYAYTLRRPHTCHGPRAAHSLPHPSGAATPGWTLSVGLITCGNLGMPTHTGEHSYHLSCLYPYDACTLRAVHITFHKSNSAI